jgi:pimeloyl-ACP methyl ester carboxylesterase
MADFTATLQVGAASFSAFAMGLDENRIVVTRTADTAGAIHFSGKSGTADFPGPVLTSAEFAAEQACGSGDPPASGISADQALEPGPFAAGFHDTDGFGPVRVHYPARCGGLRRPAGAGPFPFVMILHGNGCVALNYEYLARQLASWGFLTAMPEAEDAGTLAGLLAAGLDHPESLYAPLAGHAAGGRGVLITHSMGTDRAAQLLQRAPDRVAALVLMGPVTQTELPAMPGLVFGATEDLQSSPEGFYQDLAPPKYFAVFQGGNHSQFTDDKHWEGTPLGDNPPTMQRNRQFELVQSFTLAYLQRVFGQAELFPQWLGDPGLPEEVAFTAQPN